MTFLGLDRSSEVAVDRVADQFVSARGYVDAIRMTAGFMARGEIHRLSPNVKGEFAGSHHAGHHRSTVDSDPDAPAGRTVGKVFYRLYNFYCRSYDIDRMRRLCFRQAADKHVRITNGF